MYYARKKIQKALKSFSKDFCHDKSLIQTNSHFSKCSISRVEQTIPDHVLESHQLSGITLEYRRECGSSDIVLSLCQPDVDGILQKGMNQGSDISLLDGFSLATDILEGGGRLGSLGKAPLRYTHLLQTKADKQNEEIVRGRSVWKKRPTTIPFST